MLFCFGWAGKAERDGRVGLFVAGGEKDEKRKLQESTFEEKGMRGLCRDVEGWDLLLLLVCVSAGDSLYSPG